MKAAGSAAELVEDWSKEGDEGEGEEAEGKDTEKGEDVKMAEAADSTPVSEVNTTN